jgi:hypothetical protein
VRKFIAGLAVAILAGTITGNAHAEHFKHTPIKYHLEYNKPFMQVSAIGKAGVINFPSTINYKGHILHRTQVYCVMNTFSLPQSQQVRYTVYYGK